MGSPGRCIQMAGMGSRACQATALFPAHGLSPGSRSCPRLSTCPGPCSRLLLMRAMGPKQPHPTTSFRGRGDCLGGAGSCGLCPGIHSVTPSPDADAPQSAASATGTQQSLKDKRRKDGSGRPTRSSENTEGGKGQVPVVGTQTGVNKRTQMFPVTGEGPQGRRLQGGPQDIQEGPLQRAKHSSHDGEGSAQTRPLTQRFLLRVLPLSGSKARCVKEASGERAGPRLSLLWLDWNHLALRICVQQEHCTLIWKDLYLEGSPSCHKFHTTGGGGGSCLTPQRNPSTRAVSSAQPPASSVPWASLTWWATHGTGCPSCGCQVSGWSGLSSLLSRALD